jgi:hypothetical protein
MELCFAKIERDLIARGIFTLITDLHRKSSCSTSTSITKTYQPISGPTTIPSIAFVLDELSL